MRVWRIGRTAAARTPIASARSGPGRVGQTRFGQTRFGKTRTVLPDPSTLELLGEGGEAEVFALDAHRVLRRWRVDSPTIERRLALTRELAGPAATVGIAVPEVLDTGCDETGRPWFVERRLPGRSLTDELRTADGPRRARLIDDYLDTAQALRTIGCTRPWYGELIADEPLRAPTWSGYLLAALDRQAGAPDAAARAAIPDLDGRLDRLRAEVATVPDPPGGPAMVHFDYFPGNVMCDGDRITAVIDWSVLAIAGDPDLDVALAVAYLGVVDTVRPADHDRVRRWVADHDLGPVVDRYARFGAAWWLPVTDDAAVRPWVVDVLGAPQARFDVRG